MIAKRKPFYLKTKLLHQTKLNLWEWDSQKLKKLNKKKWDFLKFQRRGKLRTFRFAPFSFNDSNLRLKMNFKNNLYFRKLIRLQQGRLKNKEFYNIFRKSEDYRSLLGRLGSRLDVALFNILLPLVGSIFSLRQNILHGKFLLNGLRVKSPNIRLKAFDTISFRFSDLSIFNRGDFLERTVFIGNFLIFFICKQSHFKLLSIDSKKKVVEDFIKFHFSNEIYEGDWLTSVYLQKFSFFSKLKGGKRKNLKKEYIKKLFTTEVKKISLSESVDFYKSVFFKTRLEDYSIELFLRTVYPTNFQKKKFQVEDFLGFFSKNCRSDYFEIILNGDYVDIVFLGFSDDDVYINSNRKYLLHYLY